MLVFVSVGAVDIDPVSQHKLYCKKRYHNVKWNTDTIQHYQFYVSSKKILAYKSILCIKTNLSVIAVKSVLDSDVKIEVRVYDILRHSFHDSLDFVFPFIFSSDIYFFFKKLVTINNRGMELSN